MSEAVMESFALSASDALAEVKSGKLTTEQWIKSLSSRISSRDSVVQAWQHLDVVSALEQAKTLDQIPVDERGPLHGVPIAVKDIIHTKGMPTCHNSAIYRDHAPELDAGCIQILKAAGALVLGKTTTTEFASTKYGPKTCNPHGPTRTPGGSSSGSAAAVADFQAPIALGTQTGGSMIRPGSFNGIYAFKPTWGSLTREGVKFSAVIYDTLGFFTRSVEDLNILADVFAINDDVPPSLDFRIEGAKFAVVKTPVWAEAGQGTISAMEKASALLKHHGATVEEASLPESFSKMREWYWTVLHAEGRVTFLPEHCIGKESLHQDLIDQVENSRKITRKAQLEAFDGIAALRPVIDEIASKYAAIIAPSVPDIAPLGQEVTGDQVFNNMWTALHVPVVNIPGFEGDEHMPIGVSLISGRYHDRHLLAVAKVVGGIFEGEGGWTSRLLDK